jgi:hypothetical protein
VREVIQKAKEIHERLKNVDIEKEYALRYQKSANIDKRINTKKSKNKTLKFFEDIFKWDF